MIFLKHDAKLGLAAIADTLTDLTRGQVCIVQKLSCLFHSHLGLISLIIVAVALTEIIFDGGGADAILIGELLRRNLLIIVFGQRPVDVIGDRLL